MANKSTVSDSGPIIHLSEISQIECFSTFQPVFVPKPVYEEIKTKNLAGFEEIDKDFFQVKVITRADSELIKNLSNRFKLSHTDSSVLVLAHRIKAKIVFTDDLELRDAAKLIGLTPVGTIGILIRAYRERHLSIKKFDEALDNLLSKSSLYITKKLILQVKKVIKRKK